MKPAVPQLETSPPPGRSALALLLLVPAPTIGVLCAMFLFPDTWYGQTIHLAAKAWLLTLPLIWVFFVERGKLCLPKLKWEGMPIGIISGLAILGVIIGAWELFAHSMIDVAVFKDKMTEVGLSSPARYLAFAAAVTFINALLEEYVWRWFVYTNWFEALKGLKGSVKAVAIPGAIVLAGLCFMLHHTIAMSLYFDWQVNALASFGVFSGGVIWSIIYLKTKNLYSAYVSHIFADIALFYVGYRVAFG
ncbi:MAG: CPBP family intramembrane metalloprotease [Phycisphaeraceae bacterium]|nr:CPBP family intramembrane metalloprotease [Phycisphaeraceae bacterium]